MLVPAHFIMSLALAAPPAVPSFIAQSAAGPPVAGTVSRIDADGTVTLEGAPAATVAGADLIALRQKGVALPPWPAGPHVVFANGDRLAGEVLAIDNDRVRFRALIARDRLPDGTLELSIPLSALAVIWFQAPPQPAGEALARRWANERRRRDVVLSANGDTRIGTVKEMKSASSPLVVREEGRETRLEPGQLVAVAMNTDLARPLRPRGQYSRITLANGGRLGVLSPSAGSLVLTAKTLFGSDVKIPLDQIVSLDVRQGKAVYLSDLKPKAYEHTPYLSVRWPYEMDRSVAGNELRLAGSTYDKGIGLHSQSRLTFALTGQYRRFEATVGLDDRTGRGGRVKIRVLLDGKEKDIGDAELTSAIGPRTIAVDVTGGQELTLAVDFGPGGDVCDHVDWADARLVK